MNGKGRVARMVAGLLALVLLPVGGPPSHAASTTLVISEVVYDPIGGEPDREWIEIYNLSGSTIDLTNYKVGDEETFGGTEGMMRFPNGALMAPGQVIVVANKASAFSTAYGFTPDYEMLESDPAVPNMQNYTVWTSGSVALHNDGDEVLLLDPGDSVVDALSWGSSDVFLDPPAPDVAEDHSLERYPTDVDTDTADDWVGRASPAPGNVVLNVVEVVDPADSGPGTLRQALLAPAFGDAIIFSPSVFPPGSPVTISVQSAITLTQDSVTIDASNAGVILDGSGIVISTTNGIRISGAEGVVIKGLQILHFPDDGIEIRSGARKLTIGGDRGAGAGPLGEGNLISGNGDDGIFITGTQTSGIVVRGNCISGNGSGERNDGIYIAGPETSGIIVRGNYIGVNWEGTELLGNGDDGIHISQGAHDNIIGGATLDRRNLISGNGSDGVFLTGGAMSNTVQGNYIGTDFSGTLPIPNGDDGVHLSDGAHHNVIGGAGTGEGNLVSGNAEDGIYLTGTGTEANEIQGNYVGASFDGTGALANGENGIFIGVEATDNIIGGDRGVGTGPNGQGNLIVFNGASGVAICGDDNLVQGNYIGIDGSGWWDWGNGTNGVSVWLGASGNVIGGTANGYRNVISGNDHNGVWIWGSGTDQNVVIGNYVGTRADGMGPAPNGFSGVAIQGGARENRVGDAAYGEGNLISGNSHAGVYISDLGTDDNQVLGNIIGPNWQGTDVIGQGDQGVAIAESASGNKIGDGSESGRNTISGNSSQGVLIRGSDTVSNTVQGNYIGTNIDGDVRLANREEGIKIDGSAHDNRIEGNVISGNGSGGYGNGVVIIDGAHHNVVYSNFIGTDKTGTFAIGGQPGGGVDLAGGAHHNVIGGSTETERNIISGNGIDGIFIEGWETVSNTVQGNYIGTDNSGTAAIPNGLWGLFILNEAPGTIITGNLISRNVSHGLHITYDAVDGEIVNNTISHNGGAGIQFEGGACLYQVISNTIASNSEDGIQVGDGCTQVTLSRNSIYDNGGKGIHITNPALAAPELTVVTTDTIAGTTVPDARVEFFSDDDDEGRVYEGFTAANAEGGFSFAPPGGFVGPNVTTTGTDGDGNTSEFSQPAHLLWTLLLYLNGDNDLEAFMFDTLSNTMAAGPSPRANVLVLLDRYTTTMAYSGTVLYDVTYGAAVPLTTTVTITGERNMGDGQTLVDFVTWGRAHYPARHTLLAIVDHGGGWAPGGEGLPTGTSALISRRGWMAGNSGLSWDFSSDYDYLDSEEIRQAMADITNDGANPLDAVFYDVCLMGMVEVAYQIKDYASFFVSSQNIGWAPLGPEGRHVQIVQGIGPTATPRQVAELLVQAYADGNPPNGHPFTISAVDLNALSTVTVAVNQLAKEISRTLTISGQAATLHEAYSATQKIDYDTDFRIEPATDGFVDLYDFALQVSRQYTDPAVITAAHAVTTALDAAIIAEEHGSGSPWPKLEEVWDLDDVHGLSIFLPLGEDLELPIIITETSTITPGVEVTRNLRLRDMYSSDQLQFVGDTAWGDLIATYYDVVSSPVPTDSTDGPAGGLLEPDVTPPQTVITVIGALTVGEAITVTWVATDTQTGVAGATLWHRLSKTRWTAVSTQTESSVGWFTFTLSAGGENSFSVRAFDEAGNVELPASGSNMIVISVQSHIYLPLILRTSK